MHDFLINRHTIRSYSDKSVDDHLLNSLLETACRASNTGNMQAYSVVVTKDSERKKELAPFHFNQKQVTNAPVVLTFCADLNRLTKWCQNRNTTPGFANLQSLTYASIDAVILAQAFCTAAESQGLGICYLGTTTYNAEQISQLFQLPKLVIPITTVTVGYPAEALDLDKSDRLPLSAVIHQEMYTDYTSSAIDEAYRMKESMPQNQQFVEINGKENLAQVYAEIRYAQKETDYFSETWIEAIKKQGYID
jgi:FMN reductase (NADPH)